MTGVSSLALAVPRNDGDDDDDDGSPHRVPPNDRSSSSSSSSPSERWHRYAVVALITICIALTCLTLIRLALQIVIDSHLCTIIQQQEVCGGARVAARNLQHCLQRLRRRIRKHGAERLERHDALPHWQARWMGLIPIEFDTNRRRSRPFRTARQRQCLL